MSRPDTGAPASDRLAELLEESAEDLYENAPCGYLSWATDGTVVRINATLLDWTGYARDEVVDRLRIHDLLAPGDRIFYETHYAPLFEMQGAVREIAVEIVRADGARMPALLNSVLRRGDGDGPSVVRTTVYDARDRRRYERELLRARREAEARARAAAALEHVDDGVFVVDPDGTISVLNPAAEAILGLSADAVGQRIHETVDWWSALAPRIPVGTLDDPPERTTLPAAAAGHERWLSVSGIDSGEGIVYTARDVTADRGLESMRDELIGVVSHELRTPLAAVYGGAKTVLERELAPEQRGQLLETVVSQAERLTQILDQIVLVRRIDADELELGRVAFDAVELAQEVASERVRVSADGPVRAAGDPTHAKQALAALVENALKYSPADSPVDVRVSRRGARVRIAVVDEGPGIPPAHRGRIFERFHRLDPDLNQGIGGLGLGLYIARSLVERMGGRLGYEPKERGSTFFVELPPAEPGGAGAPPSALV